MKVGDLVRYYGREELGIVVKVLPRETTVRGRIIQVYFREDEIMGQYSAYALTVIK